MRACVFGVGGKGEVRGRKKKVAVEEVLECGVKEENDNEMEKWKE